MDINVFDTMFSTKIANAKKTSTLYNLKQLNVSTHSFYPLLLSTCDLFFFYQKIIFFANRWKFYRIFPVYKKKFSMFKIFHYSTFFKLCINIFIG